MGVKGEVMSGSVLLGLNVTNHDSAHCNNLIRSALSRSAEAAGSSTMIQRPLSSANKRIQESIIKPWINST